MSLSRLPIVLVMLGLSINISAQVQRRAYVPKLDARCDYGPPLTTLEDFDWRMQTVIVRGSTLIQTVTGRNGIVTVDALEVRDESQGSRALGVVITMREANRDDPNKLNEANRSYIDYDEIDAVTRAWDQVAKTDDTITKLNNFESRYRTKGDFEIVVFRQTPGGAVAASISGGYCERARILLSLDDLIKLRHIVVEAKKRLDEIR